MGDLFAPRPAAAAPVLSIQASATAEPSDDYRWGGRKVSAAPQRVHYRDLPISSTVSFDDVGAARAALLAHEQGQFYLPAQLAESFGTDDRISGVLQTRIDALSSLPLEIGPRDSRLKSAKVAERVQDEWAGWVPDAELKRLHRWALTLGFGLGELLWSKTETAWTPRLKVWDPRYAYWRWDTRSFWLATFDGPVEITPGDGHWVLYAPHGLARGWMGGSIRSLAVLFLMRRWAFRDWARYSEVHGLPIKALTVPADANIGDKEDLESALANLGNEAVVRLAQDENGKGFALALIEAKSQGHEGFRMLIERCDECIAVGILGQNLTTSMKSGGSYAAANVHDRIRMDRLESDAKGLGACFAEQVVLPWTVYNCGDAELAPTVSWSTKAPEDRAATAKTLNDLGAALKNLQAAGLNVDLEAVAKSFRVPLVEGKPLIERSAPEPSEPAQEPSEPAQEPEQEPPADEPNEEPEPADKKPVSEEEPETDDEE